MGWTLRAVSGALFVWVAVGVYACGGTAVVDAELNTGGNAAGGAGSGGGTGNAGNFTACWTPSPVGALRQCGSWSTDEDPPKCSLKLCDTENSSWESVCQGKGCACDYRSITHEPISCSCAYDGPGQMCDGTTASCCPDPFP